MSVRIFLAANERLLEIWDYTSRKWGTAQADKYVRGLVEKAQALHKTRHSWRLVSYEDSTEIYFIRYRHHYLFFRQLSGKTIGIFSILHESMDIPSRLKEDANQAEE